MVSISSVSIVCMVFQHRIAQWYISSVSHYDIQRIVSHSSTSERRERFMSSDIQSFFSKNILIVLLFFLWCLDWMGPPCGDSISNYGVPEK